MSISPFSSAISLIIHARYTHPLDAAARRQKDFLILMYSVLVC